MIKFKKLTIALLALLSISTTAWADEQPNGPTVTINEAKTEATFTMPQYDVTATYTLKRDMAVDMAVSVQDAQNNSRFRVQKQGKRAEAGQRLCARRTQHAAGDGPLPRPRRH